LLYFPPRYRGNFEVMKKVLIYSRTSCHLCEIAIDQINSVRNEKNFQVEIKLIDGSHELEEMYGEQVPVIFIDEKIHDYWRVDLKRFTKAINA
jgi:glutaredoxin